MSTIYYWNFIISYFFSSIWQSWFVYGPGRGDLNVCCSMVMWAGTQASIVVETCTGSYKCQGCYARIANVWQLSEWVSEMGWMGMGCLSPAKSFHVKIILLDKQELIQEVQVIIINLNKKIERIPSLEFLIGLFKFVQQPRVKCNRTICNEYGYVGVCNRWNVTVYVGFVTGVLNHSNSTNIYRLFLYTRYDKCPTIR